MPAPIIKEGYRKVAFFCYSEWRDEEPRKSGYDKDERLTEVCRRGETERGRSGNANPIARSNNKRRLPKGSLFLLFGVAG